MEIEIVLSSFFLSFLIVRLTKKRKKDKKALEATDKWCDIGEKIRGWAERHPGITTSHPAMQKLLRKEIETWKEFVIYHPYCDDNGEHIEKIKELLVA